MLLQELNRAHPIGTGHERQQKGGIAAAFEETRSDFFD
jgi:hypothetical protein